MKRGGITLHVENEPRWPSKRGWAKYGEMIPNYLPVINDLFSFMKVYLSIVLILTNYLQMEHLGSLPLLLG